MEWNVMVWYGMVWYVYIHMIWDFLIAMLDKQRVLYRYYLYIYMHSYVRYIYSWGTWYDYPNGWEAIHIDKHCAGTSSKQEHSQDGWGMEEGKPFQTCISRIESDLQPLGCLSPHTVCI